MALPPEKINIKRRREEEPVETLYIQSELHQTKRRFTDFVFQRVTISGKDGSRVGGDGEGDDSPSARPGVAVGAGAAAGPTPPAGRVLKTPRSVSSLIVSKGAGRNVFAGLGLGTGNGDGGASGVPLVRATSPGAEFREERRLAAARKEKEEKIKRALHSSASTSTPASGPGSVSTPVPAKAGSEFPVPGGSAIASRSGSGRASPASSSGGGSKVASSVRRFQISRSVGLRRSVEGGIQKRKGASGDAVAVLVEKLRGKSHSRKASMVADHLSQAGDGAKAAVAAMVEEPAQPRKRPVVNQAEKNWREGCKNAISAAKQNISQAMDKGAQTQRQTSWEVESERLAQEFEQIALELDGDGDSAVRDTEMSAAPAPRPYSTQPKPPLKYQPRTPNKPRPETKTSSKPPGDQTSEGAVETEDDSDEDYVYDVYIRKPLPEAGLLSNPLKDLETDQDAWFRQNGIDTTRQDIGVIVITQEDEGYWENFVENDDDEEQWDAEDADSNAENNPANDYPDEELSWDEDDDPSAVYGRAVSDDEFDFDDSASEGYGASSRRYGRFGYTQDYSDDEDGY